MQLNNQKAQLFQEFLTANNINCFEAQVMDDELNTVVFRTNLAVGGQNLPVLVATDDSLYTPLQVRVAAVAIQGNNQTELLVYINELNRLYKSFKYIITQDNALVLTVCLTSAVEQFVPQLVGTILDVMLSHLNEEYPNIMRKIWADSAQTVAAEQEPSADA